MPKHLLERGIACIVIGLAVLLSPSFITAPQLRATIAGASVVGWFGVVLGVALVAVALKRRAGGRKP
ncbi:MAG: hypothetical protein PGN26_10115 [Xylophilus ampelinus]